MKLNHRIFGESEEVLVILHGLFGSSDNWQTLARHYAEHFKVVLVDQRNHGKSPWSEEFDYELLATDLKELLDELGLKGVNVLGHSMGGKTVMRFAQLYPDYLKKMVVADIGVKKYPMHHELILKGLNNVTLDTINTRKEAESALSVYVQEFGVKQFLLKNLYWVEKGRLGWRINIPVLEREMDNILAEIPNVKSEVRCLFIRGVKSNYILDQDWEYIQSIFPNSELESLNAGHWLHAEVPKEFSEVLMRFLRD